MLKCKHLFHWRCTFINQHLLCLFICMQTESFLTYSQVHNILQSFIRTSWARILYFIKVWCGPYLFFQGYNITAQALCQRIFKNKQIPENCGKISCLRKCWRLSEGWFQTTSCEAAWPVTFMCLLILSWCSFSEPLTHEEGGGWEEASIRRKGRHLWWISSDWKETEMYQMTYWHHLD